MGAGLTVELSVEDLAKTIGSSGFRVVVIPARPESFRIVAGWQ